MHRTNRVNKQIGETKDFMFQMKNKTHNLRKTNEIPDKEFRVIVVELLTTLRKKWMNTVTTSTKRKENTK